MFNGMKTHTYFVQISRYSPTFVGCVLLVIIMLRLTQQRVFHSSSHVRCRCCNCSCCCHFCYFPYVAVAASDATLKWSVAGEGAIQSAAPEFGHQWPLSEVCLWVQGVPLVLLVETEGLSLSANPEDAKRNYSTGYKYLLLRAFRALGVSKVRRQVV